MRKILLVGLAILFFVTGCSYEGTMLNTPTKKVEMFFSNYQTLNQDVMDDLDKVVDEEERFNTKQRETYRELMKKHYQAIQYDVKDERINGDEAEVRTEIEVIDYSKILKNTDRYLQEHRDEFLDEKGQYDETKYMDYRLEQLKEAKETVKYDMTFHLTKKDKEWQIDSLTTEQEQKIHGMYDYE